MSADLVDFRGKVTVETDCVLEGESRVSKEDKSLIARRVLHEWAAKRIEAAKITAGLLASEGASGNRGEDGSK